jgi:hypothetical protein
MNAVLSSVSPTTVISIFLPVLTHWKNQKIKKKFSYRAGSVLGFGGLTWQTPGVLDRSRMKQCTEERILGSYGYSDKFLSRVSRMMRRIISNGLPEQRYTANL